VTATPSSRTNRIIKVKLGESGRLSRHTHTHTHAVVVGRTGRAVLTSHRSKYSSDPAPVSLRASLGHLPLVRVNV